MYIVQQKDVVSQEKGIDILFLYSTKRRTKGFMYKIPEWLKPDLDLYISQLSEKREANSRFIANYNVKTRTRLQNMGENTSGRVAKDMAIRLGKDPKNYTAKSFRRSACTQLIEAGISVVELTMAGNWKNLQTALEYAEHSNKACTDRMNVLDGRTCTEDKTCTKRAKTGETKVVQNNCTFINIISSSVGSIGEAVRTAMGGKGKEEEEVNEGQLKDDTKY